MKEIGVSVALVIVAALFFTVYSKNNNNTQTNPPPQLSQPLEPNPYVEEQKPVLLFFSATWCKPCHDLERDTLLDPIVVQEMNNFDVPPHVDIDLDRNTAQQYGIRTVPSYIIIQNGQVVKRGSGYKSPRAFLRWLRN